VVHCVHKKLDSTWHDSRRYEWHHQWWPCNLVHMNLLACYGIRTFMVCVRYYYQNSDVKQNSWVCLLGRCTCQGHTGIELVQHQNRFVACHHGLITLPLNRTRLQWLPAKKKKAKCHKLISSKTFGEDISLLNFSINLDNVNSFWRSNMWTEVVMLDSNVLGSWSNFRRVIQLESSIIIFKHCGMK